MTPRNQPLLLVLSFIGIACDRPQPEKLQPEKLQQEVLQPEILQPGEVIEPTIQKAQIDEAKFAHIAGEDVQLAVVSPTGIRLLERVEVSLKPFALHWLDAERFVILTHEEDDEGEEPAKFELLLYENKELKAIPIPDSEAWNVPHENDYSAHSVGGAFLDTGNDEVWMRRCAGGYLGDADGCVTFSYVRILPTVLEKQTVPPKGASYGVRFVDPPKGVDVEVVSSEDGTTSTILCKSGTETSQYKGSHYTGDDSVTTFMPELVFWVSQTPAIYAVNETDDSGEALFDYYWLFSPCKNDPHSLDLVAEHEFVYGPDGVWAAGRGIYYGNRRVAEIDFQDPDIPRYSGPAIAFARPQLP